LIPRQSFNFLMEPNNIWLTIIIIILLSLLALVDEFLWNFAQEVEQVLFFLLGQPIFLRKVF